MNRKILLPFDIYNMHLKKINGISFTYREVDVLSSLLNMEGNHISAFLSIQPRGIEAHTRNIRQKAGGLADQKSIINFIEKSDEFSLIKNEYYNSLRIRMLFEKKLKLLCKHLSLKASLCLLIYEKEKAYKPYLTLYLKKHLKRVSFEVKSYHNAEGVSVSQLKNTLDFSQFDKVLYIASENADPADLEKIANEKENQKLKNFHYINLFSKENYYLSFFELLEDLFPSAHFENIIKDFTQQCKQLWNPLPGIPKPPEEHRNIPNPQEDSQDSSSVPPSGESVKKSKWLYVAISVACISLLSLGGVVVYQATKTSKPSIRCDLILPSATILLNRSELMEQIDHKFQGLKGVRTLAIIGIGGSGKTILARHYAHQQKANIIWEINAETKGSLNESFENLAYTLATTEDDQRALYALQEIKNSLEREKRLMEFVKMRLRLRSDWLLIYDNVEKFINIQKYFPLDVETWGHGRAIITTRNNNIQNNKYMNHTLQIGELNENQKLDLLTKIMSQETKNSLNPAETTKARNFLAEIPSFPLDVSVASDYIKTTHVSYEQYLELIKNNNETLTRVQEEILEESGEYTKTRYNLITLSLQKIIEDNKDFGDLLLFISLLDSQNIPKNLFDLYKNSSTIDNFIYNLKKYSLITTELSPFSKEITLSIHRSTQAIILAYLTNILNLQENKNNVLLQSFPHTLGNYIEQALDKEDLLTARSLIRHLEAFLSHKNLLTDPIKGQIEGELGCIYTSLSLFEKALHYFENALLKLSKDENQNHNKLAQNLLFQGNSYVMLGSYRKAEAALKESIRIYKKYMPNNNEKLALGSVCLGNVYRWTGEYDKAKHLFQQSLTLYEKLPPQASLRKVMALISLGDLYRKLGDYKEAAVVIEKSLTFCEKYLPKDSIQLAWALVFSGVLHREFGHYEDAIDLINKSTAIYEKIFSKENVFISDNLIDLSKVYYETGQYAHAINLAEKAILLFKNAKVNNLDFRCVEAIESLGNAYKGIKNYEKAKHYLNNALISYENHYGKNHLETAHLLKSLGQVYLLENNLKIAEEFLGKALDIFQKNKHPHEYKCLEDFSELYQKKAEKANKAGLVKQAQQFKNQAHQHLKQALDIVKTHFPEDSPHTRRIQSKFIQH